MCDDTTDLTSTACLTSGEAHLEMQTFFPYRLAVLADAVSRSMAELYAARFSLTRHEWRVIAALANHGQITATDVAEYSTLDKMQVSRAVAGLEARGLIARGEGQADRRTKLLKITPEGRALFAQIVPLVIDRQAWLLEVLSQEERTVLDTAMDRLLQRARQMQAE